MHDNNRRRTSFGVVAEAYDRERPGYPDELIETIVAHAGVGRALEIGCGTGIATRPFAERGLRITAVEPSEQMALVARRNLAEFQNVRVELSDYESWPAPAEPFDLVFCAQAWHWITPEARFEKTPSLLKGDGYLAVFAHMAIENLAEAQEAYARWWPEEWRDAGPAPSTANRIEQTLEPIREHYRDVELFTWPWSRRFTAEEYLRLLGTYSDHSTVPEPNRTRLFDAIAEGIENAGGAIERHYLATLIGARPQ